MQNPTLVAVIIIVIFIFIIFKKYNENNSDKKIDHDETDFKDHNEDFFNKSQGKSIIPFIRVFAPKDKILLRSILNSEDIPTYVGSDHINNLLPGLRIQGHTDVVIYIFEENKNQAKVIVEDYIRNLIESINPEIDVKIGDFFALINALPTSFNQILPEIIND